MYWNALQQSINQGQETHRDGCEKVVARNSSLAKIYHVPSGNDSYIAIEAMAHRNSGVTH